MKNELFTLRAWFCWAIHSLVVGGALMAMLFVAMQWQGIQVEINIPTIEHTFKTAHK